MNTALLNDFLSLQIETNDSESKSITSNVNWQTYETLIKSLGDSSSYRVAYILGNLEIMSPSRNHELTKENIGRLLDAYLEENQIRFWGLGSTTFRNQDKQVGKEPDKCYCIATDKDIPDLAIEVIYTSGGVDTLKIYQRLGVKEVWFWEDNELQVYCLQGNNYQQRSQSQLFPNLDLKLFAEYVAINDPLEAIIQWRKQIRVD